MANPRLRSKQLLTDQIVNAPSLEQCSNAIKQFLVHEKPSQALKLKAQYLELKAEHPDKKFDDSPAAIEEKIFHEYFNEIDPQTRDILLEKLTLLQYYYMNLDELLTDAQSEILGCCTSAINVLLSKKTYEETEIKEHLYDLQGPYYNRHKAKYSNHFHLLSTSYEKRAEYIVEQNAGDDMTSLYTQLFIHHQTKQASLAEIELKHTEFLKRLNYIEAHLEAGEQLLKNKLAQLVESKKALEEAPIEDSEALIRANKIASKGDKINKYHAIIGQNTNEKNLKLQPILSQAPTIKLSTDFQSIKTSIKTVKASGVITAENMNTINESYMLLVKDVKTVILEPLNTAHREKHKDDSLLTKLTNWLKNLFPRDLAKESARHTVSRVMGSMNLFFNEARAHTKHVDEKCSVSYQDRLGF